MKSQIGTKMENKKRYELKRNLPKGAIKIISERTKLSKAMVSSVLSGQRNNDEVLDVAIELVAEFKQKDKDREQRMKNALAK